MDPTSANPPAFERQDFGAARWRLYGVLFDRHKVQAGSWFDGMLSAVGRS